MIIHNRIMNCCTMTTLYLIIGTTHSLQRLTENPTYIIRATVFCVLTAHHAQPDDGNASGICNDNTKLRILRYVFTWDLLHSYHCYREAKGGKLSNRNRGLVVSTIPSSTRTISRFMVTIIYFHLVGRPLNSPL